MTNRVHREIELQRALQDIYNDARYRFSGNHGTAESAFIAGQCRWCGAPSPDDDHDHDVACPAAKAGYALGLPGYRDGFAAAVDAIRRVSGR